MANLNRSDDASKGVLRPRTKHRLAAIALAVTVLGLSTVTGLGLSSFALADHASDATGINATNAGSHSRGNVPASFAEIADTALPAVVNISTARKLAPAAQPGPEPPFAENSPFGEFFRHFFERYGAPSREVHALGSGFIIDPDGYVVTNHHVIEDASDVTVILDDGSKYPATVVGADTKTDLALLKIDADEPLPSVQFGESDAARVGDWVLAVGNPFGLGGTVTAGIISARGRTLGAGPYDDFLQIDAPINRGNSGGPTFGMSGKVIGINTAIYSPNGGSVGIGFAIPASLAKPVIQQLREQGKVVRGWLGVRVQEVDPDLAEGLGLQSANGALVASVQPGSPAADAGLQQGDVIGGLDDTEIETMRDLPRLVAALKPGTSVELRVWRDDHTKTVEVTLGRMPSEQHMAANANEAPSRKIGRDLGVSLTALTPSIHGQFGIPEGVEGVLVTGVRSGSSAAEKGIRPGDVIVKVGGAKVRTPSEIVSGVAAAREERRDAVVLLVNHKGNQRFVALRLRHA